MPAKVLKSDWSEYNDTKIRTGSDISNFNCSERWEADYLVQLIRKTYPFYKEVAIRRAMTYCCNKLGPFNPREYFVISVMRRLKGYAINNKFLENHS